MPPEPLRFSAALHLPLSRERVWAYFADLDRWPEWSPVCRRCRVENGDGLVAGAVLRLRLRLLPGLTLPTRSHVVDAVAPETAAWETRLLRGARVVHRYRFEPRDEGVAITNEESFHRFPAPLRSLVKRWFASRRLSRASLDGLRRGLETALTPPAP